MSELIQTHTPQILDFMIVSLLLCGVVVRMHRGLYKALMPLAVVGAAAVCGLTLSAILSGPISNAVIPPLKQAATKDFQYSLVTVEDYDAMLAWLERGATDEVRKVINLSRYSAPLHEAAHDAGDALATVNNEVLTDENIDAAVDKAEDAAANNVLLKAAREAVEEKGLTGDAARQYIRQAGDALGSAGDTVLTDENIDAALNAVQKELNSGAEALLGDGTEAREGREAMRSAEDRQAAAAAAIGALIDFLTPRYVRVMIFLIGWIAFIAVLTTIKNALGLAFDLPVIKQVDKIGGAILGFVEAAVAIWFVLWLVRYLGFNTFRELGKQTIVLRFFA